MKPFLFPVLLIGLTFTSLSSSATEVTIDSGWRISIGSDVGQTATIGAIELLVTPSGSTVFIANDEKGLFDWIHGVQRPTNVDFESFGDHAVATLRGFRTIQGANLPLTATITFSGNESELFCDAIVTATSTCRLDKGLGVSIPIDGNGYVDFYNTKGKLENNTIPTTLNEPYRLPAQHTIVVRSGMGAVQINLRNPILPTPARTSQGVELELLAWYRPNTTNANGLKNLCSILLPGDTVRASWGVTSALVGEPTRSIALFSPHPYGGDCSAMLAFDDIPSLEPEWAVPTNANDLTTPITSGWLKILDEFPDIKFTWLLLTDSIQRLGNWHFIGWWPPTSNVYPDSSLVYSGNYSCRLALSSGTGSSAVITQIFAVTPGKEYSFEIHANSQYPDAIPNLGIGVKTWKPQTEVAQMDFYVESGVWTRHTLNFVSDSLGVISISIRAAGLSGDVFIDDARLIEVSTNRDLQAGSGFERFVPYIGYESTDSLWASARSIGDFATEPPQEYLDWLKIVQDGSPAWSYTNQVGLGLHGLHHTPDTLFATDVTHTHEFNFFDPVGDSIRMKRIADDLTTAGLDTNKILAFFRFPGHRHTESLMKPLFDHGVRVIDQGNFTDAFYSGMFMRHHRRIWVTSSVSWHDKTIDAHLRHLESSLNSGMFSLMGCHYHIMNAPDTPGERERARNVFNWIESTYPDLVWMKGAEIADLWDEFDGLRNIRQNGYGERISLTWEGAIQQGETIYLKLQPPQAENLIQQADDRMFNCSVDGEIVEVKHHGSGAWIVLPKLGPGEHRLDASVVKDPPVTRDPENWKIEQEEATTFSFARFSASSSSLSVRIFDASGRQVVSTVHYSLLPGRQTFRVSTPASPSGIYFAQIDEGLRNSTVRLARLR